MTDLTTSTIDEDSDWREAEAHQLRPGSRFRFTGILGDSPQHSGIHTVVEVYEVPTWGPSELSIVTGSKDFGFKEFGFKDFDLVLVIPSHERSIALSGASHE